MMIEFDSTMVWRRRTAVAGSAPGYTDSEISLRVIGERRRRAAEPGAESREEVEIVCAPPAEPQPGDLLRRASTEYRVVESIPRLDLDGVLRGCTCRAVRTETEFDTAAVWRQCTGSSSGAPVYRETAVSCQIVRRLRSRDAGSYDDTAEEVELLFAPPAEPQPGDLVTLGGGDYRITRSSRTPDPDGNLLACRCTAVR